MNSLLHEMRNYVCSIHSCNFYLLRQYLPHRKNMMNICLKIYFESTGNWFILHVKYQVFDFVFKNVTTLRILCTGFLKKFILQYKPYLYTLPFTLSNSWLLFVINLYCIYICTYIYIHKYNVICTYNSICIYIFSADHFGIG